MFPSCDSGKFFDEHVAAIKSGDLNALSRAQERTGLTGNAEVYKEAIRTGNIDMLRLLEGCDRPYYGICYEVAAQLRPVEKAVRVIRYFYSKRMDLYSRNIVNCIFNYKNIVSAILLLRIKPSLLNKEILHGMLEHSRRSKRDNVYVIGAIKLAKEANVIVDDESILECIVGNDNYTLEQLELVHKCGYPASSKLYMYAATRIDHLKYVWEVIKPPKPAPENDNSMRVAMTMGTVETIQYLINKSYTITQENVNHAYNCNGVSVVSWLYNLGYVCDEFYVATIVDKDTNIFCHDNNITKPWNCDSDCRLCHRKKNEILRNLWFLETSQRVSYIQWLPNEMMDDIRAFFPETGPLNTCLNTDMMLFRIYGYN